MKRIKVRILDSDHRDISEAAKVVIYNSQYEVLFLRRTDNNKEFKGNLDLPGGHLKRGESSVGGLKREVSEETSIKLTKPVFFKKNKEISFFIAKYNEEQIKLSDEHDKYLFISVKNFDKHNNLEGNFKQVAQEAIESLTNET